MNKRLKFFICIIIFLGILPILSAQNQPSFEQYHFNQLVINPAYAGSTSTVEANAFYKQQWTSLDGAPTTMSISLQGNVMNDKIGLGFKTIKEKIGVTDILQFGIQYAYRMHTDLGVLAIGIDASATNFAMDYQNLDAYNSGDQAFIHQPLNSWSPNFGGGIWFHSKRFYAGASSPILIPDSISGVQNQDISQLNIFQAHRHYYFSTGVLIGNLNTFAIKPYTLIKYAEGSPVQAEGSMSFIFKNIFWIGGSYRTDNSITIMSEYFIKKNNLLTENNFGFGFAYHFSLEPIQNYFGSTHELFITYALDKKTTQYSNPRFF